LELVGRFVRKTFVGHGTFVGEVVRCTPYTDKVLFSVQYPDGDQEDMDLEEVEHYLVPVGEVVQAGSSGGAGGAGGAADPDAVAAIAAANAFLLRIGREGRESEKGEGTKGKKRGIKRRKRGLSKCNTCAGKKLKKCMCFAWCFVHKRRVGD
jgi:hypothetical protein